MKLTFDSRGNLFPYEITEISFEEFKASFVNSFSPDSKRYQLFEKYMTYMDDLSKLTTKNFYQWIDGSFISTKVNPRDLDIVTVLSFEDYEKNKTDLSQKFISHNARKNYKVDAYIVGKYPENHEKYIFTQSDLLYWMNLFEKTKVNKRKQQFRKGFIQINFNING